MTKVESLNDDRKAVRAALGLLNINPVLKTLILKFIDRLYDELIDQRTDIDAFKRNG